MTDPKTQNCPIAVVGVSALFPGSTDAGGFWTDILEGRDMIRDVPPSHWLAEDYYDADPAAPDKTYGRRGAYLDEVPFAPMDHGVPPSIVPSTDTSQLLALIVAQRVLEDAAQGQFEHMDRERISVILGATSSQELLNSMVSRLQRPVWVKALREAGLAESKVQEACERISDHYVPWQESTFPGLLGNVIAGRIANRLNLGGTNCVTDAACASSLSAVNMAVDELILGRSDLVISGGVDTMSDIFMQMCFSKTPALSPTGDCRPFSDQADGTILGEGLGMVALRRLEDAERDGDRIYAVLMGVGSSSDGRSKSVYAPVPEGQARALNRAYDVAGYAPSTVELVEAHGTGTKAGDAAEFQGLSLAFDASGREDRGWCAVGSVKSQIGHTKAAAGAAGLFKVVMALHHGVLPPTIKVSRTNPKMNLDESPFYVNTEARPWVRGSEHPRRASVSSFGFGGSNFHVALEEYQGAGSRAWRKRTAPTEVVLFGAESPQGLRTLLEATEVNEPGTLPYLARTTQEGWSVEHTARVALVAKDEAELKTRMDQAAAHIADKADEDLSIPGVFHYTVGAEPGEVAFLFPGQGSQYVGMGAELAMTWSAALDVWDQAADIDLGAEERLHEVVFPRPVFSDEDRAAQAAHLTSTQWAQPALGVSSMATLELVRSLGIEPRCVGGHSFGEVTALYAAGVLDRETMVRVARRRGELMNEAASIPGAMTAAVSDIDTVRALVESSGLDVVVANHNAPRQVVLSGPMDAIEAMETVLGDEDITARRLPVATAFHSHVVSASTEPFLAFLNECVFQEATLPVYANSLGAAYPADLAEMRQILGEQIEKPVRFVEELEAMYASGVRTFIEVGPGSVLTRLAGQIFADRPHRAISTDQKGKHGTSALNDAIGRMAVAGLPLDLAPLWAAYAPLSDPRLAEKPAFTLSICGSNYGKPYPPPAGAADLPGPNPEPVETPAVPVSAPQGPAPDAAWLATFQELQRQTFETHARFQESMLRSHESFLAAAQTSLGSLQSALTGSSTQAEPTWSPQAPPLPVMPPAPVFTPPTLQPAQPTPALVVAASPAPVPAAYQEDLGRALLEVVADKTGYPMEMLGMHMALETDLGVDSIKRVEILSEIKGRVPSLPDLEPTKMATLETLGEIDAYIRDVAGQTSAPAPPAAPPQTPTPTVTPAAASSSVDLGAALLEVVGDKTGYPVEMLGMHMALETDLGVDSIKRVEILSEIRNRVPSLPDLDPTQMATLETLGEIDAYIQDVAGQTSAPGPAAAVPSTPTPTVAPVAPAAAPPSVDLATALLEVVADKTGYPVEMLGMHMALETDLGVDSIKRVEILSEIRNRVPSLPDLDPTQMATLETLGEIDAYIQGVSVQVGAPSVEEEPEAPELLDGPPLAPLGRHLVVPAAAPPIGLAMAGLARASEVLVTEDESGVAAALVTALGRRGIHARTLAVDQIPPEAEAVVYLGGLCEDASPDRAMALSLEVLGLARTIAPAYTERGGVFMVVQDTGGDFGLRGSERAWLAGPGGLAKTASLEWPEASVRVLDIDRGERSAEAIAEALAEELVCGGPEVEVGLRANGSRLTLTTREVAPTGGDGSLGDCPVIVASGGARGVTAATLVALAKEAQPRLVLLGRTALEDELAEVQGLQDDGELKSALLRSAQEAGQTWTPAKLGAAVRRIRANREIRKTLQDLAAAGSEARYVAVDVTDQDALGEALSEVRMSWGPITGIIHGAGVLADKLIAEKTDDQAHRVLATKVEGLQALLGATSEDPLTLIGLFSSVAARSGNRGQSDYAMANEILNKVAWMERARRGSSCVVKAFGWGPWRGGMVTPQLEQHFRSMGVPLIPLKIGAKMLVDELLYASPDPVELVLGAAPNPNGLGPLDQVADVRMDLLVSATSHPYLADHSIEGTPVVPVVLALEWFARLAEATRPDLDLVGCRDLQVLRGIRLEGFDNGGDRFILRCNQVSNGDGALLEMDLRSAGGVPHYRALADMEGRPREPASFEAPDLGLKAWTSAVYGDPLFHGPEFQVIRSLDGVSTEGMQATMMGVREAGWGGDWTTDAAALDGGLQLALLWTDHVLGGRSLPTSVAAYRAYGDAVPTGPVRCTLRGRIKTKSCCACDITFTTDDGSVVAELLGVETHRLPGGKAPVQA